MPRKRKKILLSHGYVVVVDVASVTADGLAGEDVRKEGGVVHEKDATDKELDDAAGPVPRRGGEGATWCL